MTPKKWRVDRYRSKYNVFEFKNDAVRRPRLINDFTQMSVSKYFVQRSVATLRYNNGKICTVYERFKRDNDCEKWCQLTRGV